MPNTSSLSPRAATAEYLCRYFKTEHLDEALQRRGWSDLDDFIEDVGVRPTTEYSLSSKGRLQENATGAATYYYKNRKGEMAWCIRKAEPKPSQRVRPTLYERIGATKDKEDHDHPLFKVWLGMLSRCYRPESPGYERYQHRKPAKEWLNFKQFASDMGERPEGTTLERLDNTLGYSAENCVWASRAAQAMNKANTAYVVYGGVRWKTKELAAHLSVTPEALKYRVGHGWPESEWAKATEEGVASRKERARRQFAQTVIFNGDEWVVKDLALKVGMSHSRYVKALKAVRAGVNPEEVFKEAL
jgi:hypothetical protein